MYPSCNPGENAIDWMWDDIGGLRQLNKKREQIEWGGGDFFQRARSKFISSNLAISNTKCRWTSDIKVSPVVGNDPGVAALLDCATLLYWCSAPLFLQDGTSDVHSRLLHEGTTATLNPIPIHWLSPKPSPTAGFRRYQHYCRLQFNGRVW